jgi:elongation factor G
VARLLTGSLSDGDALNCGRETGIRMSGFNRMGVKGAEKLSKAEAGDTIAIAKLDEAETGQMITSGRTSPPASPCPKPHPAVYSIGLRPLERRDEVKLSASLQRLHDEDPSLRIEHHQETGETLLHGNGEMHLRIVAEILENRYQIAAERFIPTIPFRETITAAATQRGKYKKQSGGHGQFGDVVIDIKPLPRGEGFMFTDTITGGVVPKQYIPSVEQGVREFLQKGPLGFPVVDIAVNLSDGSAHSVDSSDLAFQMAGKLAMREAMPECRPILLEPVMKVDIVCPSDGTARITAIIPQRRGQILGFEPREGWNGWDVVFAMMPQAEIGDLIIDLRSLTLGVASFTSTFDHMEKLDGRQAEQIVARQLAG